MEEGTVTNWLIKEGDTFSEGQEIVEIETSKISNVLEAPPFPDGSTPLSQIAVRHCLLGL